MVYGLRTYEWICVMKYFDSQSLCGALEWVLCVNYLGKQLLCIVLKRSFGGGVNINLNITHTGAVNSVVPSR